ncbi:oxygen-insensitive NADPH nitroreductase [Psychrobacillus lasiicapitis]|uniref:Oxygen-insensitive NADPH nitroreductase n=1 Tax=Psychrobacillus lasiicapitis TaxID=1636719 RepID=A0A544TCG7_9BACI|nr:oxygen-insensitive NADPH nitroreductase [Psychrobacillus lasiicapitis]TQR15143.1 oxygen-insensitive NADPH nitroreductase [Psychrobacillus lasiicapitis]GGA44982.1 NADPH-dependent oxidoreductase [Psychrobacillus lasiicapitis]
MVEKLLRSHSSVRKYKDYTLTKEEVIALVETAQHAASSHFVQAYSIIWVTDAEKKEELGRLSKNPKQFETAGAALLLCADFHRLQAAGKLHNTEIVIDTTENVLVGAVDVALFAQNLVIAAESKGYGICFIGGVRNAPKEISQLVDLPEGVFPLFAITLGVPDQQNEVKPRLPVAAVLHENSYDSAKYESLLTEYDHTMEEYYANRGSNQKVANWTQQMAEFLESPRRPHIREFLASKGFHLK